MDHPALQLGIPIALLLCTPSLLGTLLTLLTLVVPPERLLQGPHGPAIDLGLHWLGAPLMAIAGLIGVFAHHKVGRFTAGMGVLTAVMVVGMLGFAVVTQRRGDYERHYPTVAAARRDGAFERGWLPEVVPNDSQDIHEVHDIDTNVTWACFRTPSGLALVRARLSGLSARRVSGPIETDRVARWWPASMSDPGIEAYEFREEPRFSVKVGIDARTNTVCLSRAQ